MFSAIRNNIGYQNVASLMQHNAEYETTDVIDIRLNGRVASMGASQRLAAQRLSSARSLTTPKIVGTVRGYGLTLSMPNFGAKGATPTSERTNSSNTSP